MMSVLQRSSFRHLSGHPGPLLLAILGVSLGVAVVVAMDLAIQSSRQAFSISAETVSGSTTHQVVGGPAGLDEAVFTLLRIDAGVRESAPVVEGYASSDALPGRALRILGLDPFSELPFRPFVAPVSGGADIGSLIVQRGAVAISGETARLAGIERGDSLALRIGGGVEVVQVMGFLEPANELTRRGVQDLVVADVAEAQRLLGSEGRLSRIDLVLPVAGSGFERVEEITSLLPAGVTLQSVGERAAAISDMTRAFNLNLTALSLLALVFGMFLIYNTTTFSVVQRRPLLGILRALGVTRGEVIGLILVEAAVLGVVGSLIGLGAGVLLGRSLVGLVTQTVNDLYFAVAVDSLVVPVGVLAKGALLGVVATVGAALLPAREATFVQPRVAMGRSFIEDRARRSAPVAAIWGFAVLVVAIGVLLIPSASVLPGFAALFGLVLGMALLTPMATVLAMSCVRPAATRVWGVLGALAARGVVDALSRTAPAVAALSVAVSVTIGMGMMIGSFRGTLERWLDVTLQADVYLSLPTQVGYRSGGVIPPELIERIAGDPEIAGLNTYRRVEIDSEYGITRLTALDLDVRGEAAFTWKSGRPETAVRAFRNDGAVLVSEPFAHRHRVDVGSTIRLPTTGGPVTFPVAGVFFDYGSDQGIVMMSRQTYDRSWDDPGVTSLGLFVEAGASADGVVERVRTLLDPGMQVVVRSNQALKTLSLEVFDRTFAVTAVLRTLAFVVAFIAVVSALMALQLERARELGVLRANGLTPEQVWHLVTAQTGLMGFIAGLMAMPMGIALAAVMILVVNKRSFGWTLQMELGPEVLVQGLALAMVGSLLAGVYPAWRMSRTSPAMALRNE